MRKGKKSRSRKWTELEANPIKKCSQYREEDLYCYKNDNAASTEKKITLREFDASTLERCEARRESEQKLGLSGVGVGGVPDPPREHERVTIPTTSSSWSNFKGEKTDWCTVFSTTLLLAKRPKDTRALSDCSR